MKIPKVLRLLVELSSLLLCLRCREMLQKQKKVLK